MKHKLWTVADVAEYTQMSRSWVYKKVAKGELPHVKIGSQTRFNPAAVAAYLGLADPYTEPRQPDLRVVR